MQKIYKKIAQHIYMNALKGSQKPSTRLTYENDVPLKLIAIIDTSDSKNPNNDK